jgi:hypothetical protein
MRIFDERVEDARRMNENRVSRDKTRGFWLGYFIRGVLVRIMLGITPNHDGSPNKIVLRVRQ